MGQTGGRGAIDRDLRIGASAEQRVMEAIRRRYLTYGDSPSLAELEADTGIREKHLNRVLSRLERSGMIHRVRRVARSIRLADRGAMMSRSELALAVLNAGGAPVVWATAPIATAFPPAADCGVVFAALVAQIDDADQGERHGATNGGEPEDQGHDGGACRAAA